MEENQKDTTTSLDIFNLPDDDLYDDEQEEEVEEKPKRRKTGAKKLAVLTIISLVLAIVGLVFGLTKTISVNKLKTEIETVKKDVAAKQATIDELNTVIGQKDAEIQELKKPVENKKTEDKENKEVDNKSDNKESHSASSQTGNHGSVYKVVSNTGANIRADAYSSAEVIASLAYGEEFTQDGSVITDDAGNKWVASMWDDGYICIQLADGTVLAELN